MCEYSNDASFSLGCLDAIDDILSIDRNKRVIPSSETERQRQTVRREQLEQQQQQQQQQQNQAAVASRQIISSETTASAAAAAGEQTAALNREAGANRSAENKLSNQTSQSSSSSSSSSSSPPPPPSSSPSDQHLCAKEYLNSTKSDQMSWRNDNLITCMLITANVGTIFEESTLLELWFQQLKSYLIEIKPQLVAIHCQEVGGKNYETSMRNVSNFTEKILGDQTIIGDYSRVRIFLDENFRCLEKFTALGSLYLIHDSVADVRLYNFKTAQYDTVEGRGIFAVSNKDDVTTTETTTASTNEDYTTKKIQSATSIPATATTETSQTFRQSSNLAEHVEKIKFPQELFPECRWSRKGFMRTRWLFNNVQPLDLVNIHLFHDASNLVAMKATPSPYAQNRQRALGYALERISKPLKINNDTSNNNLAGIGSKGRKHLTHGPEEVGCDSEQQVPLFIFGDFNFRLDTNRVIQRITEGVSPVIKKSSDNEEVLEIVYHRKSSGVTRSSGCNCANQTGDAAKRNKSDNGNESPASNQMMMMGSQQDDSNSNYIKDGGVVMTIGKKLFDCENLDEMFRASENTEWLLELDNELDNFRSKLHEFKISFSPSYPFKEDETGGYSYMKTRCPSWCDRILFNEAGNRLIYGKNLEADPVLEGDNEKKIALLQDQGDVIYRLMGNSVPMGDHKPVLLYCKLKIDLQASPVSKCKSMNSSSAAIPEPGAENLVQSTAM